MKSLCSNVSSCLSQAQGKKTKEKSLNVSGCQSQALGMEHGHIPDSALAASSTFDMHSVGPHIARARKVEITLMMMAMMMLMMMMLMMMMLVMMLMMLAMMMLMIM